MPFRRVPKHTAQPNASSATGSERPANAMTLFSPPRCAAPPDGARISGAERRGWMPPTLLPPAKIRFDACKPTISTSIRCTGRIAIPISSASWATLRKMTPAPSRSKRRWKRSTCWCSKARFATSAFPMKRRGAQCNTCTLPPQSRCRASFPFRIHTACLIEVSRSAWRKSAGANRQACWPIRHSLSARFPANICMGRSLQMDASPCFRPTRVIPTRKVLRPLQPMWNWRTNTGSTRRRWRWLSYVPARF